MQWVSSQQQSEMHRIDDAYKANTTINSKIQPGRTEQQLCI